MAMQLAPEGKYHGKIIKQDVYTTKEDGGTPFLGFDCLLTQRDNEVGKPEDLEQPLKRRFSLWINSPKNVKNTTASLRFLGFMDNDINKVSPWSEEHISLVGKEVSLDISHKENEQTGDMQENIWLSRAKKALDKESSASVLAKAAELFKEYQNDYLEKKVSKMTPEELAEAAKRAEEKAKKDMGFPPPDNEFPPPDNEGGADGGEIPY